MNIIKTFITVSTIVFVALSFNSYADVSDSRIIGAWKGKGKRDHPFSITFFKDNTLRLIVHPDDVAGKFKVNISHIPYHIDIDFGKQGIIKSIIEVIDINTMKMENTLPGKARPLKFTNKSTILNRVN